MDFQRNFTFKRFDREESFFVHAAQSSLRPGCGNTIINGPVFGEEHND
jgi:hypothetical protein